MVFFIAGRLGVAIFLAAQLPAPSSAAYTATNATVVASFPGEDTSFTGLARTGSGDFIVSSNKRFFYARPAGLEEFAGRRDALNGADGIGTNARFFKIGGFAINGVAELAAADDSTVRAIQLGTASVTTVAGDPTTHNIKDGTGTVANFLALSAIAVLPGTGRMYVADSPLQGGGGTPCVIRRLEGSVVTTIAGDSASNCSSLVDGTGAGAGFQKASRLALSSSGDLFVADKFSIRLMTPAGLVTTLAGSATGGNQTDGLGTAAQFKGPTFLAFDATSSLLFVADMDRVRAVAPNGAVTTYAGGGQDSEGVSVRITAFGGLTVTAAGGVYLLDVLGAASSGTGRVLELLPGAVCPPGYLCSSNLTGSPCPPGSVNPLAGQGSPSACTPCPQGRYSAPGGQVCLACPIGQASGAGQSACQTCPSNTFAGAPGSGTCTPCSNGSVSLPGSGACCALGSLAAPGSTTCVACTAGTYLSVASDGNASCQACAGGTFSQDGAGACCALGQFVLPGSATCQDCARGRFSSAPGANASTFCTLCASNTYSTTLRALTSDSCITCGPAYYSEPGAESCETCRPGLYLSRREPGGCAACLPGRYSSGAATQCSPCPAGSYTPTESSVSCYPCSKGDFCPEGSGQPVPCPPNTHGSTYGMRDNSSCVPCEAGTYAPRGSSECLKDTAGSLSCPPGQQPSLLRDGCVALVCLPPLAPAAASAGSGCTGCRPGTAGSPSSACTPCAPSAGLCPGLTLRPLLDFSAAGAAGLGACPRLTPNSPAGSASTAAAAAAAGGEDAAAAAAAAASSVATLAVGCTLFILLLGGAAYLWLYGPGSTLLARAALFADVSGKYSPHAVRFPRPPPPLA